MVKSTESTFRDRSVAENFSSFEKHNASSGQKPGIDAGRRVSRNKSVQEPHSPEDLRQMKGNTSVTRSSTSSRKYDQWNVKRDIPVGSVRNNPFLPESKHQPPPSPQLKYQKKQYGTSNIPKGSVAARIQKSNSPRSKSGGNKPISPSMVMEGSNSRPIGFFNNSSGYSHTHPKEPPRSNTSTSRGFSSKGGNSSPQMKHKSFAESPGQPSSQKGKERAMTSKGWEPSQEIPSGTVKGRLSSLYGGQKTSTGRKVKDLSTSASNLNEVDNESSVGMMATNTDNKYDDEDQWIIPDHKGANLQVFSSDWGEAIPAKSAESDDWETPAKDWIRSGESHTEASSCKEVKQKSTEKQYSLPEEIAAPFPNLISQMDNGNVQPKVSTSAILAPPPKDASTYHRPKSHKSQEDTFFDPKSSISQEFSDTFESFATKTDSDLIDKKKTLFPTPDDINQQLINGTSDAFGFPLSSTPSEVENRSVGEVVSGDEFFDASALPDDYGQPSSNTQGFDASAPFDDYRSQPRKYKKGYDASILPKDYGQPRTDNAGVDTSAKPNDVQPTRNEQDYNASTLPSDYDPQTRDEPGIDVSVPKSYGQSSNELGNNLDRYPSTTSAIGLDNEVYSSMNGSESGKGDLKKKKKGFLKGLFGRKSKGSGKVKQSATDNKTKKDRSYSKSILSNSLSNSSEGNIPISSKSKGRQDTTLLDHKGKSPGKESSRPNDADPVQSNQIRAIQPIEMIKARSNHPMEENRLVSENHVSQGKSEGDNTASGTSKFNDGFSTQNAAFRDSVDPNFSVLGNLKEPHADASNVIQDDIFGGLEQEPPSLQNSKATSAEEVFLDPDLDHLDSNIDSDAESNGDTIDPSKTNIEVLNAKRTNETSTMRSQNPAIEKRSQDSTPRNIPEPQSFEKPSIRSSKPRFSPAFTNVSSRAAPTPRPNVPIRSQHSLVPGNGSTSGSNFRQKRFTEGSDFNGILSVNDTTRQEGRLGAKRPQGGTYGGHNRIIRSGSNSQNVREKKGTSNSYAHSGNQNGTHGKKFSRAAHAYNIITKKNMSEDAEDERRYLSIPSASTSASDMSYSSTYDSYQKKLGGSLRKANIAAKNSSEYSLYSTKSLDDSSIESDIRVLRSILRRPRLDHDNESVIKASRQIHGFPTYDTESATDPMQRLGMRLLSSAIIPIQSEVRRFLAMRQGLTRMWALLVIQAYTRRFLARKKFHNAVNSAITIQSVLRGHIARNDVIDKHICAIEIQRFVRGYLATMQVYEDIYKVTLIQSLVRMRIGTDYAAYRMSLIIQLQAIARGFLERRRQVHRNRCATLIQSSWRCFYNRLNYQFDLLDIIIVQSLWRKKLDARVGQRKLAEKRNMAATIIQTEWRAYDCRMDFLCYTSARTIQTKWRSHNCMKNYIEYQASAAIQSAARMLLCRLQYIEYQSAMTIQSLVRMHFCRTDYTQYKCAKTIQSIGRMYLCRYDYLEYRAATTMQSAVRMFLCRSGYVEYHSATKIQAAIRMFLCRSDYTNYGAEIAATAIQAKWRSYDCSSMYKRYRAARTIQKTWRSYDCQMNFLHFLADILIVQSTIRRFLVQRKVKAMKNDAATSIQSAWRGLICYIDYHEHLTVRRIQSAWRGHVCRRNYKREKAAILIQCSWRGFLFYADYMFELSDIVVVQKEIRGWLAKRAVDRRRCEVRNFAATTIQKHWRRVVDENRYEITKRQHRASIIIQTNWRRFWCFSNFVIALDCSIQIQAQIRGYIQRKDCLSRKASVGVIETAWLNLQAKKMTSQMSVIHQVANSGREVAKIESSAAIKLQQVFRGSLCRNALKIYLATVLIQSRVRGKQARVAVGLHMAVRKIQAVWRAFVPHQSYITYIAARRIQATWRSYFPRQSYITLRKEFNAATSIQSAWRGFVSYTDFVFTVSDIVAAQRFARGYLSRKKYSGIIRSNVSRMKTRVNGAIAIQRIFRGFQARQNYWYTLGCSMQIQSWWRGRRVCRRIQKEANAVSTLQCFARCCLARQEYMQRRFVFMLIQTAEVERSKKVMGLKMKDQRREDREEHQMDDRAARVIQRFFSDVDHEQSSQLMVATKRRKEWREKMKKEKYTDGVEETMLEDVWTGLVGKSDFVDEPFTRHYDDFSKLAGPAMVISSHPTSSIRMIRKNDAIDMDDDFQLEEAFIDAEICHAKERRYFSGSDRGKMVYPPLGSSRGDTKPLRKSGNKKRSKSIGREKNKGKKNILAMSNH